MSPLLVAYVITAVTGHKASLSYPIIQRNLGQTGHTSTASGIPGWMRGCCKESQATSPHARWTDGSKAAAESTVISPARKKKNEKASDSRRPQHNSVSLMLTKPTGIQFGQECRELFANPDDWGEGYTPLSRGGTPI